MALLSLTGEQCCVYLQPALHILTAGKHYCTPCRDEEQRRLDAEDEQLVESLIRRVLKITARKPAQKCIGICRSGL